MPLLEMQDEEKGTIGGNGTITLQKELQFFVYISHDEKSVPRDE